MPTHPTDHEDRQNPGLAHDAGRRGEADRARQPPDAGEGDPRDGVPGVGRGLDEDTGSPTSSGFGV
jgi:hypothetical protein